MTTYSTSTSEEKYMTALVWDDTGNKRFEQGVDKGVIYPLNTGNSAYDTGYAWNGITTVTETPAGAASNPQYADNIKYLDLLSAETFGGDIQAFTYPDQFALMDGTESPEALSLIHISEPTRLGMISYAVFCLKKKKKHNNKNHQAHKTKQKIKYQIPLQKKQ